MKLNSLRSLELTSLRQLYHAEDQILSALPALAQACSSTDIRQQFETLRGQTKEQKARLEKVFDQLDAKAKPRKCRSMRALLEEAEELIAGKPDPAVLDAGLIAVMQKVAHYEIAAFGCARTWTEQLGASDAAGLLQANLEEIEAADRKLTELAVPKNQQAATAGATGTTSRTGAGMEASVKEGSMIETGDGAGV